MKKVLITGMCLAMGAASYADIANLGASADTMIWHRDGVTAYVDGNFGSTVDLDTYHFDANLNAYSYIQFNMSSLGDIVINSATLTLTKAAANPSQGLTGSDRVDTITTGRIDLFGLNNVAGNTVQNWDESTLTMNNTGNEITTASIAAAAGAPFLNSTSFAGLEAVSGGTVITLTGTEITAFLQGRADDNGYVTFMTANPDATAGRGYALDSKESGINVPLLSLDYTVIPEPATLGLIGMASVGLLVARRFRI